MPLLTPKQLPAVSAMTLALTLNDEVWTVVLDHSDRVETTLTDHRALIAALVPPVQVRPGVVQLGVPLCGGMIAGLPEPVNAVR